MADDKRAEEFQVLIKTIHDDICSNPLRAFDTALQALSVHGAIDSKEESRLVKSAARAALQSVGFEDAINSERPLESLFAPSLTSASREKIGVCLLRLLAAYPNIVKHPEISHRLAGFFDDVFDELSTVY